MRGAQLDAQQAGDCRMAIGAHLTAQLRARVKAELGYTVSAGAPAVCSVAFWRLSCAGMCICVHGMAFCVHLCAGMSVPGALCRLPELCRRGQVA